MTFVSGSCRGRSHGGQDIGPALRAQTCRARRARTEQVENDHVTQPQARTAREQSNTRQSTPTRSTSGGRQDQCHHLRGEESQKEAVSGCWPGKQGSPRPRRLPGARGEPARGRPRAPAVRAPDPHTCAETTGNTQKSKKSTRSRALSQFRKSTTNLTLRILSPTIRRCFFKKLKGRIILAKKKKKKSLNRIFKNYGKISKTVHLRSFHYIPG